MKKLNFFFRIFLTKVRLGWKESHYRCWRQIRRLVKTRWPQAKSLEMRGWNRTWKVSYTGSGAEFETIKTLLRWIFFWLNRELRRMNDECADKIADNRFSIDNSRDWLVTEGGVIDRVHRMSAKTVSLRNIYI